MNQEALSPGYYTTAQCITWLKKILLTLLLFLLSIGILHAAVVDPIDDWAIADITRIDSRIQNDTLYIDIDFRDALQNYLDHGYPVFEIFIDSDNDESTGDYRSGAVAGVDFIVECFGDFITCSLHRLPHDPSEQMDSQHFSVIPGAAVTLVNSNAVTLQLPVSTIGGNNNIDLFVVAFYEGNHAILDNRIERGNGDRCPNAGTLSIATGDVVVRRPGNPVNVTLTSQPNNPNSSYDIIGTQFSTFGDQFELTITYDQTIDLASFVAFRGGVIFDSDRKLETGQIRMIEPEGLGLKIPSWGGDAGIRFMIDDMQTILTFTLYYETNYGTLYSTPIPFGSSCGQDIYPATTLLPCNDGSWKVEGHQLILSGSLSLLDADSQGYDFVTKEWEFTEHPADGHMILRTYTVDEATNNKDIMPDSGRGWDTGTNELKQPLLWSAESMISEEDPAEYGLVYGHDLIRVDAQLERGNLIIKGVLSFWSDVDPNTFFEILLDTDMNSQTGEYVENNYEPGYPAIGADYRIAFYVLTDTQRFFYFTELTTPDQKLERHDAFSYIEPNSLISPEEEDSFTITIPLSSLNNPDELSFFVGVNRTFNSTPYRVDIAPPQPIVIVTGGQDSDGDGLTDNHDNCSQISNPDQRDTDNDDYGNLCDADLDNSGLVNSLDLGLFKARFLTTDQDADFNGDGIVNSLDLGIFKQFFLTPPGPSGLVP